MAERPSAMTKQKHDAWGKKVRYEIEPHIASLKREAETEEEHRDVRRLWDLMNDICSKHARRAAARSPSR